MSRLLKVDNCTKDFLPIIKCMVGINNPESEYIGVMANGSTEITFFRTTHIDIPNGICYLNSNQRKIMNFSKGDSVYVCKFLDDLSECVSCNIIIDTLIQYKIGGPKFRIMEADLDKIIKEYLIDIPIFEGLEVNVKIDKDLFIIKFHGFQSNRKITDKTVIKWYTKEENISFGKNEFGQNTFTKFLETDTTGSFFKEDTSNESIGNKIGGFVETFKMINRRAFNSRLLSKELRIELDILHSKGILLYGISGTGKSTIAYELSQMINYTDIKFVNGPEIFDKYVGGSESKIREIFAPADLYENENDLLLIIIDEIDSICPRRSDSSESKITNNVVNQLLTEIDGSKKRNNIFIIGTTNRKDIIDGAILRDGRIDIHIEIGLPDLQSRLEILQVHTKKLKNSNKLDSTVNLLKIAEITINYSGAELRSIVLNAINRSVNKNIDQTTNKLISEVISVTQEDLINAVNEIEPIFGSNSKEIDIITQTYFNPNFTGLPNQKITNYSETYNNLHELLIKTELGTVKTIMLKGQNHCGKTKLLANLAKSEDIRKEYKFIKYINSWVNHKDYKQGYEELVNLGIESTLIIFDSIEDLIMFCGINNSYSNVHVQSIYRLLNLNIESDKKLTIIVSSSDEELTNKLKLNKIITHKLNIV